MRIKNSVAIVTGGARGIGKAIAESLLTRHAKRVIIADLNSSQGGQTVQEFGELFGPDRCQFVQCSVTDSSELRRAFEKALELEGRLDILANNAGVLNELDPRLTIEVNVTGVINGGQLAIEFMSKQRRSGATGGCVVSTASAAGLFASAYMPAYTASKHAVVGWTGAMGSSVHYKRHGIRFNCLCPALVATDMLTDCLKPDSSMTLMSSEQKVAISDQGPVIPMSVLTDEFARLVEDPREFNGFAVGILPPGKVKYIDKSMKALL